MRARVTSARGTPHSNARRMSGVALVTGATDGIGRHTARRLAAAGRGVVAHGRRAEAVRETVRELEALAGGRCVVRGVVRDLSDADGARALVDEVLTIANASGGCSALFNNAGVFMRTLERDERGLEMTHSVNVRAPYELTAALLPELVATAKRSGVKSSILNVASISASPRIDFENMNAEKMFSAHGSYSLSKACMKAYSYELFDRLVAGKLCGGEATVDNLNVFSCDPGTVNTKMLKAGWGMCGIDVAEANDEFDIMVTDFERNSRLHNGCYFVDASPMSRSSVPGDADQARLWSLLENETGVVYC